MLTHNNYIRDITDKSPKYFSGQIVALNHEFSIFWTYSGWFVALNQDFGCNSCSGATKCPEKFSVALSVVSLLQTILNKKRSSWPMELTFV